MTLGEKVIESLEQFRDDLRRGDEITVQTVKRCECGGWKPNQTACAICSGRGYIINVKTLAPKE